MQHRRIPLLLAAGLLPGLARAQELDADSFNLSGGALDDQGTLQLVHPHIGNPGSFYAGLGAVYSHQPLVYRFEDGTREVLVDGQFSTRLAVGYNVVGAVRIDLEVPIYPWLSIGGESSFAMGNIRLGAVVPLVKYEDAGIGLAIAPYASIPSATPGAWVSDGGFSGGAVATLGGKTGRLGWDVNVGADLGAATTAVNTTVGSALTAGAGLSVDLADYVLAGLELNSNIDLASGGAWNEDPTEGHLYFTFGNGKGMTATLGGGTGLVPGVGAPAFRGLLLLGYRAPGKPIVHDVDGDGLLDDVDHCPNEAEDFDKWQDGDGCPEADNDKDGILDAADKCPDEAEDFDQFADEDGCPDPDNDGDGILDDADQCPIVKGVEALRGCPDRDSDGLTDTADACPDEAGPESTQGCPDRDSDRVPDSRDKCPDAPADPRIDPKRSDGCPARVIVTKNAIQILDKIYFDTNKATIKKISFSLLDEIAKVINENQDIKLIEVSGHTDSQGDDAKNMKLSQARADSVVAYLTLRGAVAPTRLTAKGFGETKPVDTNDTDDGRAMNRRVEFNILEQ
jgi:outer membrane protein OmpA-like peptidoglycan-associated protein